VNAAREIAVRRILPRGAEEQMLRAFPVESPISIEINGIGYAVMMATPIDLEDFAVGFCLSERIVSNSVQIEDIEAVENAPGWLLKIRIVSECVAPMMERVRVRVSESSCGLCGLENLEQVLRPLPAMPEQALVASSAIFTALSRLNEHQPVNRATGGAHGAAYCSAHGEIMMAREDVGRHCALDKLIGAMARVHVQPDDGFFLLSSRCSYELVEKTVLAGCATLVTISTATTLAVERAAQSGLRLVVLARSDAVLALD
jgi:FdhD protein